MPYDIDPIMYVHGIGNAMCAAAFYDEADKLAELIYTAGYTCNGEPMGRVADPNTRGDPEWQPKFLANVESIRGTLAKLIQLRPTPLMVACFMGSENCVDLLLDQPGIVLAGAVDLAEAKRYYDVSLDGSKHRRDPMWQESTDKCVEMVVDALWDRLRGPAFRVGKLALFTRRIFEEVHFRPGHRGAKRCRQHFEDMAAEQC